MAQAKADVKLGFWIALGFFLFALVIAIFSWLFKLAGASTRR